MTKRPDLHVVEGHPAGDEDRTYRLRESSLQSAPTQKTWPKAGAWRDLVQKLVRKPVKGE
jgi:hypothetical protein